MNAGPKEKNWIADLWRLSNVNVSKVYSKQETAQLKQAFWTRFGQYMKPVPTAGGEKNSWVNYKTGIQHIYFRMTAEKGEASIAIELAHPAPLIRNMQYEQFEQLKNVLQNFAGEEWTWQKNSTDAFGKPVSRIFITQENVNVMKESDWPSIISFLKPRIIALDAFWNEIKYGFE